MIEQQVMTTPHRAARVVVLTATSALAAVCWLVAAARMRGMDMGVDTDLGRFWPFLGLWVAMMAAMMLPGALPAIDRLARGGAASVPLFVGSYVAVWTLVGAAAFALYRPHGTALAGAVVIAAGGYELTPVKRYLRQRCRQNIRSGLEYGMCCVGMSIGLMAMLVALGVMSLTWVTVVAVLVTAQKAIPTKPAVDVPLALAVIAFGVLIVLAPAAAGWR